MQASLLEGLLTSTSLSNGTWRCYPRSWLGMAGDPVVIKRVTSDDLEEGEIITFRAGQGFLCHRLVGKEKFDGGDRVMTKGDNRAHEDTA